MASADAYLETFISLAKTTDGGKVTADIVMNALKHRSIFFYAALLDVPAVQKLKGTPEFELLDIFSFGTYEHWSARRDKLPALSEGLVNKLRQLTMLHLAATQAGALDYATCQRATGITSVRDTEDLAISCVYNNLLRARLDQKNSRVIVDWAMGRDVRVEALGAYVAKLDAWCANADGVLAQLKAANAHAERVKSDAQGRHSAIRLQAEQIKAQVATESENAFQGKSGGAASAYKAPRDGAREHHAASRGAAPSRR